MYGGVLQNTLLSYCTKTKKKRIDSGLNGVQQNEEEITTRHQRHDGKKTDHV